MLTAFPFPAFPSSTVCTRPAYRCALNLTEPFIALTKREQNTREFFDYTNGNFFIYSKSPQSRIDYTQSTDEKSYSKTFQKLLMESGRTH